MSISHCNVVSCTEVECALVGTHNDFAAPDISCTTSTSFSIVTGSLLLHISFSSRTILQSMRTGAITIIALFVNSKKKIGPRKKQRKQTNRNMSLWVSSPLFGWERNSFQVFCSTSCLQIFHVDFFDSIYTTDAWNEIILQYNVGNLISICHMA